MYLYFQICVCKLNNIAIGLVRSLWQLYTKSSLERTLQPVVTPQVNAISALTKFLDVKKEEVGQRKGYTTQPYTDVHFYMHICILMNRQLLLWFSKSITILLLCYLFLFYVAINGRVMPILVCFQFTRFSQRNSQFLLTRFF